MCFRKLLTHSALLKPGGAALGPTAWWRLDDGPWQRVPLGSRGRVARSPGTVLEAPERPELTELFELLRLGRRRRLPALGAVALRDRLRAAVALDGLSDHLLAAARAARGGEPSRRSRRARLAALCAEPADQRAVQRRTEAGLQARTARDAGRPRRRPWPRSGSSSPRRWCRSSRPPARAPARHGRAATSLASDEILAEPTGRHEVAAPEPTTSCGALPGPAEQLEPERPPLAPPSARGCASSRAASSRV